MARAAKKLTARQVATLSKGGRYGDGGGLWLNVTRSGTKNWVLRYSRGGRAREMGLGPASLVSLAEAREKAWAARRLLLEGGDPLEHRRLERLNSELEAARAVTFQDAALRYIAAHSASWKNAKHRAQWTSTLEAYAYPHFGQVPVASIDTGMVLKALEPIWHSKPETASRLRGRIEAVLDWATARGYRMGENPARWRGHLQKILPARSKISRPQHHAALPYQEISTFMAALAEQSGTSARGLEFAIFTAARTSEVMGATWGEVDLEAAVWAIPADRMKGGRDHLVPLSRPCLGILEAMAAFGKDGCIFKGARKGKPLSTMAFLMTLRRMGRADLTVHGFRSTFRDWVSEKTSHPSEVAEMALAHSIGSKVEAAYRRGQLFEKRRFLMEEWGRECTKNGQEV